MTVKSPARAANAEPRQKAVRVRLLGSISFTTIKDVTDTSPVALNTDLAKWLDQNRNKKKGGNAFLTCTFLFPNTREAKDIDQCHALVLDVDKGNHSLASLRNKVPYGFIAYETASSTPTAKRWRVVIPFTHPCTPDEYRATHAAVVFEGCDPSGEKPAQLWFAPTTGRVQVVKGKKLKPSAAIVQPRKKHAGKFSGPRWTETGVDQAVQALMKRDPACSRKEGLEIACALHDGTHGDDEGLDIFETWSSGELTDATPSNYVPGDCAKLWDSLKPGKGVTRASLFVNGTLDVNRTASGQIPPAKDRTASEIMANAYPRRWEAWAGRIATGAYLLVARPKCGKSWFHLNLAEAVSTGAKFMGAQCAKSGVLLIAAEDRAEDLHQRFKDIEMRGDFYVKTIEDVETIARVNADLKDAAVAPHKWVEQWLEAHTDVKLVIIDTQATFEALWHLENPPKQGDDILGAHYKLSRLYQKIGQRLGVAIVLTHHAHKRKGTQVVIDYHEIINLSLPVVAGAAGSIVLADHPDAEVGSHDVRRVLAIRGRHVRDQIVDFHAKLTRGFLPKLTRLVAACKR